MFHCDVRAGASRRQFLRQGATVVSAAGALSVLGEAPAGAQPTSPLPLHPRFPTSPRTALPKPVQDKLDEAMERAIELGKPLKPYGFACVLVDVDTGDVVAEAVNTSVKTGDISAHAELNVLRDYAYAGKDPTKTVLVTTAEPCAMCATMAIFARFPQVPKGGPAPPAVRTQVAGVAYGSSIEHFLEIGRASIGISMPQIVASGPGPIQAPRSKMPVVGGVLHKKTDRLFAKPPGRGVIEPG